MQGAPTAALTALAVTLCTVLSRLAAVMAGGEVAEEEPDDEASAASGTRMVTVRTREASRRPCAARRRPEVAPFCSSEINEGSTP